MKHDKTFYRKNGFNLQMFWKFPIDNGPHLLKLWLIKTYFFPHNVLSYFKRQIRHKSQPQKLTITMMGLNFLDFIIIFKKPNCF